MSDVSKYHAIRRVAVTSGAWTAITCPIECARFVIENTDTSNSVKIRTDSADSATEKTLPAGFEYAPPMSRSCFQANDSVCYVQSVAPTATVCVSFHL